MKHLLLSLIAFFVITTSARAQFGLEVGGSYNIQNGTFKAPCGCTMANGNGFGYFAGAQIDLISFLGFSIGVEPGYEVQNFTAEEIDSATMATIANGDHEQITMPYISISPYFRYTIPDVGIFLQVSPGFKYLLTPTFQHTGPNSDEPNVSPTASMNVSAQRYDGKISVGYDIGAGPFTIAPTISAAFPFTSVSEIQASGWHVTTIYGSVIVRI